MALKHRFPLTSEQLELLLALEASTGLQELARGMAKDPSVISRNLQRIADLEGLLCKVNRRWQLTPLGRQLNERTRAFLSELEQLGLGHSPTEGSLKNAFDRAALVLINTQVGLLGRMPGLGRPCEAEMNLLHLLRLWREIGAPVFHVRHLSEDVGSSFFRDSSGFEFLPKLLPLPGEHIFSKRKASAFAGTSVAAELESLNVNTVVIGGFTANECIDASARDSGEAGFDTFVVGDATASMDVVGPDGTLHRADRVHALTLANIHANSAHVINTSDVLLGLRPQP